MTEQQDRPSTPALDGLLAWWKRWTTPGRLMLVHPDRLDEVRAMVVEFDMVNHVAVRASQIVPEGQAMLFDVDNLPEWLADELRADTLDLRADARKAAGQ